ncbi:MAG: hypothetical protein ACE5EC_08370, partial [Phycisphaerae bacterium]
MSRLILTPAILCCLVVPAQAQRGGPSGSAPKITDIPTVVNPSSLCAYPSHPRRAPDGLRALSIEEAEPNDSVSNAQPIPVGDGENMDRDVNVSGAISSGSDKDTFRLTAVKGDVLGVACLGLGQMDPIIKVLDDIGNRIFENDDDSGI